MAINPNDSIYEPYYAAGWRYTSERTVGNKTRYKFYDADGVQRCGGKKKTATDEICLKSGKHLFDNGRCRFHGGATPTGSELPQFQTGIYSQALAPKLQAKYEQLLDAEQLIDLRQDIALISTRVLSLLETLDDGELSRLWLELNALVIDANADLAVKDIDEFGKKWRKIRHIVSRGGEQYLAWQEASQLVEQKRKLVETDSRISLAGERSIAIADHFAIITALVDIFLKYVKEPEVRLQAQAEMKRRLMLA